ncbi:MAG: hypothetical protein M3Y54_13770 [Bacteroidota bacterium]|nr:hypothetical protein [Bacteroidota bacterium]
MNAHPATALATATARVQRLEIDTAGVLAQVATTALNTAFFAQRLAALRGVHCRQIVRFQELLSHSSPVTC